MYKKITQFFCRALPCTERDIFLKMKLTLIIFMCSLMHVTAASYGQNVTLNVRNIPFDQLLDNVSRQSGYHFLYDEKLIAAAKPVSISLKNVPVEKALIACFSGQPLMYVVKENNVIITGISRAAAEKKTVKAIVVSGTVTDDKGLPLPGVSVKIKGSARGTFTSKEGKYSISGVENDALLSFSYVGYQTKEVVVNGQELIDVTLIEEDGSLKEVVVVAYGTQKRANLTGSLATVKSEELTQAPVASTANTLAGRLPGLVSQQTSGQPGGDQAAISIRGFGQALWIVDGVETDFNIIDPNQIESLTILKDGSAAIYGARAGNGVILVTTKRGINQKPTITLNSSYTLQGIIAMAKPASSGQYAELQNEKFANQGLTVPYTPEQVQKYYDGTDPQYPNTNWFKETIRDWSPQQQQNMSVRGGSEKIKYYGFFGYLDQQSLWKSNGGDYKRYNLQSNIDAQITDNLSIQLDLSAVSENKKFTNRSQGPGINTVWQDLWNSLPIYPATLPDPTKYSYANGQGVGSIKLVSDYEIAGYDLNDINNYKGTFAANYKISQVPGLSAKALFNYNRNYLENKNFTKPYEFYTYDVASNQYALAGALGTQAKLVFQNAGFTNKTGQFSLNYDHVFGKDHHLTALALYEVIDYKTSLVLAGRDNFITPAIEQLFGGAVETSQANSSATENGRTSYVGRLNYSYKDKYLLEATLRSDASARFPSAKRRGYFPSVSLGWRLDQEDFVKNISGIDELKFRGSYGSSGLDDVVNFQYLSGYKLDGQWLIGSATKVGLVSTGLANPNLTWEKIKIYNIGLDFSFLERKLFGDADAFYRQLSGIPATRILSLPNTFGAALPPENLNSQNSKGFEFRLGTSGDIGQLKYQVTGNISWSRAKWDHYEEQVYTDPDQLRLYQQSGRYTDIQYGYRASGLFTSQAEISNLKFTYPAGNLSLRPGDIKYIDINNDGKLDYRDQENIGKGTIPHWMAGSSINLKYGNFDLSSLFQGAFGYYTNIVLQHGGINYSDVLYKLRWSETNNSADAFIPRLGGSSTNDYPSDHFYKKAAYLRLKSLSVGYVLPKTVLEKLKIQQFRIYLAGTNLVTLNKLKAYDVDPEAPSGNAAYYYPQQRTISAGVNLSF